MYSNILFPTDGGPGSDRAMECAFELARTFDATLHTLYDIERESVPGLEPSEPHELDDTFDELGNEITQSVQERAIERGLDIVRQVRDGVAYRSILEYVDEQDIDLIVLGTRGRSGPRNRHLGSTTQRVISRTDVPVWTVALEESTDSTPSFESVDRILVPTDGSDAAERAAVHACDLASRYDADVRVVYVVDVNTFGFEDAARSVVGLLKQGGENAVETIADLARERDVPVSTAILRGNPDDAILQYGHGADADLIAMGTRGQTADERFLGSTTARVVRRSGIPVLTVQ